MKRFDEGVEAAYKILKDALQTGCLGEIISVSASCYMGNSYCNSYGHIITNEDTKNFSSQIGWDIAPDWVPREHHQRFDAYLNTYSHVTNLLRYLFNQTPSIEFASVTECVGQLAVLKFDSFYATLQTGKMSHRGWSEEINIIFSEGEIKLQLPPALLRNVPASVTVYRAGKIQERTHLCPNWSWSFQRQAVAFVNDILDDNPMRNSAEEAYLDILLIEKLWRYEIDHNIKNTDIHQLKLVETDHQAVIISSAMSNVNWCEAHPNESRDINVFGTLRIIKALSRMNIKIIFLSSDYVFNGRTQ